MDRIPSEIWHEIAQHIDNTADIRSSRLVSQQFNAALTPFVHTADHATIRPNGQSTRGRRTDAAVDWVVPEAFAKFVRNLNLDILLPPPPGFPSPAFQDQISRLSDLKGLKVMCLTAGLDEQLLSGLDVTPTIDRLLEVIHNATNGNLTHLMLGLFRSEFLRTLPTALLKMHNLQTLAVGGRWTATSQPLHSCTTSRFATAHLHSILERNPHLRYLRYDCRCTNDKISLHDIFPSHTRTMHIAHIAIVGEFLPAPIDVAAPPLPTLSHPRHLYLKHQEETLPANIDQLWDTLMRTGVALDTLSTGYVSSSLIDYLASYHGLQSCILHLPKSIHPGVSVASFRRACSAHATTLAKLEIRTNEDYMPSGCNGFGIVPDTWIEPSTFPKLSLLYIPCSPSFTLTRDNYCLLRDFVCDFPAINSVTIKWFGTQVQDTKDYPHYFYHENRRPRCSTIQHDGGSGLCHSSVVVSWRHSD